jgi:hypothetical protein
MDILRRCLARSGTPDTLWFWVKAPLDILVLDILDVERRVTGCGAPGSARLPLQQPYRLYHPYVHRTHRRTDDFSGNLKWSAGSGYTADANG